MHLQVCRRALVSIRYFYSLHLVIRYFIGFEKNCNCKELPICFSNSVCIHCWRHCRTKKWIALCNNLRLAGCCWEFWRVDFFSFFFCAQHPGAKAPKHCRWIAEANSFSVKVASSMEAFAWCWAPWQLILGNFFDTRSEALLGWRGMDDWTSQAKANRTNRGAQGIARKCAGQESLCPWKGVFAVVLQQRYHFFGLNVGSVGTLLLTPCPIGGPRFVWCYPGMFWSACCRWERGDQTLCGSCKAWLVVHVAIVLQSIEISSTDEGGPECFWASLTINIHATAMFQIFSLFRL